MQTKKVCLIIPYYGIWPNYFTLFADSCRFNRDITFLLFTDLPKPENLPDNVVYHFLAIATFKQLFEDCLRISCRMNNPYKLCDYKPAYGLIFQEYIKDFQYWGHCDIDIILGEFDVFLNQLLTQKYDIISCRKNWLSGSFCLYKNTAYVNHLFQASKDYQRVFEESKHFGFDEVGRLLKEEGTGKLSIFRLLEQGQNLLELETTIESMTHLVEQDRAKGNLNIFMEDLACENLKPGTLLYYSDGTLTVFQSGKSALKKGESVLYYHSVFEKYHNLSFKYPNWKKNLPEFYIANSGFYTPQQIQYLPLLKIGRRIQGITRLLIRKLKKVFHKAFS